MYDQKYMGLISLVITYNNIVTYEIIDFLS